jgi:hypothetical protein
MVAANMIVKAMKVKKKPAAPVVKSASMMLNLIAAKMANAPKKDIVVPTAVRRTRRARNLIDHFKTFHHEETIVDTGNGLRGVARAGAVFKSRITGNRTHLRHVQQRDQ